VTFDLRLRTLSLPLRDPFVIARASHGEGRSITTVVAELRDLADGPDGPVGIGEGYPDPYYGDTPATMAAVAPLLLEALEFRSNNARHRPVIEAIDWLRQHKDDRQRFVSTDAGAPIEGLVRGVWRELILEKDTQGNERVNRINYEIYVLQQLREKLRCKEIWVVGADRYRNPDDDLPLDFEEKRASYYQALDQPEDAQRFIASVQKHMQEELELLDKTLPKNPHVRLRDKGKKRIVLSPLSAQPEPRHLVELKAELMRRWPMTSLLDVLKETDPRVGFTELFKSLASREHLEWRLVSASLVLGQYPRMQP